MNKHENFYMKIINYHVRKAVLYLNSSEFILMFGFLQLKYLEFCQNIYFNISGGLRDISEKVPRAFHVAPESLRGVSGGPRGIFERCRDS